MTREEQLAAAEHLAADGVLTAAELARVRRRLGEPETAERQYEDYVRRHIARAYREPDRVIFPPLEPSMVRQETVELWENGRWRTAELRYILTWVDVPDSRGTVHRRELALALDGHDRPRFAMERAASLLGKESNRWLRLRPVR